MSFLLHPLPLPHAKKRVFCFTHAGGNAASFVPWAKQLAPELELYAIQLPGRGHRFDEPHLTAFEDLVDEIAIDIEQLLDKPYVFFGHSMGSLLAFETARLFRRESLRLPRRLIVAAFVAPQHVERATILEGRPIHQLAEAELVKFLRMLGSQAAHVALEDPVLRRLMLPVVRADFEVLAGYHLFEEAPLEVPITALAGDLDQLARPELVEDWRPHALDFTFIRRDRGHFLIEDDALFLLDLIRSA